MNLSEEIIEEKQEIKSIFFRFKKRDFSGNTGQAIKNSTFQFSSIVLSKIGSLIFTIILARMLLPDLFGLYSLALSTLVLFSSFSDMGVSQAAITFISEKISKSKGKAKGYFLYLLKIKFILIAIISLALLFSSYYISNIYYNKPIFLALLAGALYIPLISLISFLESFFKSLNNFKLILFKDIIYQFLRLVLTPLAILLIISKGLSNQILILGIFLALIIAYLVALLFMGYLALSKPSFLKANKVKLNKKERKDLSKFLLPLSATVLSGAFFGYIDIIMLGHFVDSSFIGFYQSAFSLAMSGATIMGFASSALFPIFARIKKQRLEKGFIKSRRLIFLASLAATIFTFLVAPFAITLIYGNEFAPATTILQIFCLLLLISPILGLYNTYYVSKKKTGTYAKLLILSAILNIVLNYFFITYLLRYGMFQALIGATIATIVSRYIYLAGLIFFRRREK